MNPAPPTDTARVIDAQKHLVHAPRGVAPEDPTLIDASRWALWQTLARGLSHSLANASQLLTLDAPPPALLAEARARVSRAQRLLVLAGRPSESSPTFLPAVLADFDALQQLQTGLPVATLVMDVEDPSPPCAIPEGDVLHVLLLVATRFKEACDARALEIAVRTRAAGGFVHLELSPVPVAAPDGPARGTIARPALLEASAVLVTRAGGSIHEGDSGWALSLPVMPRD